MMGAVLVLRPSLSMKTILPEAVDLGLFRLASPRQNLPRLETPKTTSSETSAPILRVTGGASSDPAAS